VEVKPKDVVSDVNGWANSRSRAKCIEGNVDSTTVDPVSIRINPDLQGRTRA
jgi:hypothetical protein